MYLMQVLQVVTAIVMCPDPPRKLYHPELPPAKDVPFSWSSDEVPYYSPDGCTGASVNNSGIDCVPAFQGCNNATGAIVSGDMTRWCEVNLTRVAEAHPELGASPLADQKIADAAIRFMRIAKNDSKKRPFFIGVGFREWRALFVVASLTRCDARPENVP